MVAVALHCRYVQTVEEWSEAPPDVRELFREGTRIVTGNCGVYVGFERQVGYGMLETGLRFSWRQIRRATIPEGGPRAANDFDRVAGRHLRDVGFD